MTTILTSALGPDVVAYSNETGFEAHNGWVHCFGMLALTPEAGSLEGKLLMKVPASMMPNNEFDVPGYAAAQPCVAFTDHLSPLTGGVACLAYLHDGGEEATRGLYVGRTLIPAVGHPEGESIPFAFDSTNLNVVVLNGISWRIA